MKKLTAVILAALLSLSCVSALALQIAVPNDTTNEARALLLLAANGVIKLDENAGITATVADITENPLNIEFYEVEAANVPNVLVDVDYAIINNNYALDAGFSPAKDSLLIENAESPYVNVLSVKEGNEETPEAKALAAALSSKAVADYISSTWADGSVVCVIENVDEDGYDDSVDYDALAGKTISVAASPTPHAQVLAVAKDILAAKNITLDIIEFADYVQPNLVVDAGEVFANYFAHIPYQQNFNEENGTHLVNILGIHVEPMALYGGKQADLNALGVSK
jgi:D-methionine transport system substrate-binding protein